IDFLPKLRYLSGKITEIFFYKKEICVHSLVQSGKKIIQSRIANRQIRSSSSIENNLTRLNVDYFTIKVTGLQTSISLLKCLIGHPKFYSNIMNVYQFL
ncbi:hypothetical protein BLA29_014264, partial [Euroglyphus maynei]